MYVTVSYYLRFGWEPFPFTKTAVRFASRDSESSSPPDAALAAEGDNESLPSRKLVTSHYIPQKTGSLEHHLHSNMP